MEAKDTVIHNKGCPGIGYITGGSLGDKKIHYACTCGREAQAEISFKAGKKEGDAITYLEGVQDGITKGRKEVVEWVEKQPEEDCVEAGYLRLIDSRDWQASKKEWGIE